LKLLKSQELCTSSIIENIIHLNTGLSTFWSNSLGWAPESAANLMNKSRLDWQVSLSKCLNLWTSEESRKLGDGVLILAWTNLGSLIEGSLKLFLAVFYDDYKKDLEAVTDRNDNIIDPDTLGLEKLRQFFNRKNTMLWSKEWNDFVLKIQGYRNSIHAFKNRKIGTFDEFEDSVKIYLELLMTINSRLPYPDEMHEPPWY